MPTSAAAPLLEPTFPTAAAQAPAPAPLSGRELYRRAVHAYLAGLDAQGRANEPLARRRPAQWDRAIDVKWDCLPSIVRRRWDAESHRLWPRNGDNPAGPLAELDLFCSPDEVYYVRRRRRKKKRKRQQPQWHMTEAHIRSRYLPVYNILPPAAALPVALPGTGNRFLFGHAGWAEATNVINYARGLPPNTARLQAIPASQGFADNGRLSLKPSFMDRFNDIGGLPQYQQNVQTHVWRWHKALGRGGFGIAMLYRYTDLLTHITHFRVVVKRDRYHGAGDMERSVFESLQAFVNVGITYPKHIIGYQGPYTPALDTTIGSTLMPGLGRTYLDYAPFGCLHDLFDYYNLQGIIFPEPFLWHLLYCLTKAAKALEQPLPGHKAQMFNYDLKPENVLLDYPDLDAPWWCQRYPLLLTADLGGVGVYPNAGQAENPHIRGLGTYGFMPWELLREDDQVLCNSYRTERKKLVNGPDPKERLKVNEKMRIHTTIYQIGLVLYHAMTLQRRALPQHWLMPPTPVPGAPPATIAASRIECLHLSRHDFPPRHTMPRPSPQDGDARAFNPALPAATADPNMDPAQDAFGARPFVSPFHSVRPQYSARLVECVYRCLEPEVARRPGVADVLAEARDVMRGLEARWPAPPPDLDGNALANWPRPRGLVLLRDKYPLGGQVLRNQYRP